MLGEGSPDVRFLEKLEQTLGRLNVASRFRCQASMTLMVKCQSTFDEVVLKSGKPHVAINQTLHGRGKLAKIVVTIDSMTGASATLAKRAVVLELDVRELGVLDIPRIELFALGVSPDEPAHARC